MRKLLGPILISASLLFTGCKGCSGQDQPFATPAQSSAAALATYEVHRTRGPMSPDGVLAEASWDGATRATLVRSVDGKPTTWATEVRLLWDDERLYVAFLCEDRHVSTPFTKDDEPLYTSNVVEIFLNPAGDLKRYFEVELSPANVLFDASFTGRRQGMALGWASQALHGVHVDGTLNDPRDVDRGWTAELFVPFAALDGAKPQRGATWRFNLFRLLQGQGQPNEGQAYSAPLVGDFHAVDRFAYLKFVE